MKTLFRNILVLAVMLGTLTSYANETIKDTPSSKMLSEGDHISVSNASGEVLYSGRINYNGQMKSLYDFSQLENGIYTVEVNKDYEIEINSVQVKNHLVTFLETSNKKIFKPVFRSKDSQIIISKLAIDTNKMTVELYFENDLIHSETIKGNDILNRVYKLDQNLKGNYTAIIRANDRVFVENFKI
ncbi:hypothetical protein [Winogradskyella thalassocola]|uniref:Por secretion system C-terminal sorting domain-containing protein n=1 Tax=Winogradskyella thalassocola TaxID=262004 RepID=A0A1G7WJG3_9FLAO|nr:hypothetical protein [Winogradskyella thalassocola]SDG72008.1 hypothetical protein SAMN04489796_101387 [Winogradskyella thalassocola]